MRIATALRLGRVGGLPTVLSNVFAGLALAGRRPHAAVTVALCAAVSLIYLAGTFLNDAFDRDEDRAQRADRPIVNGEVPAGRVFDAGFTMLFAGIATLTGVAVATHAGWKPILTVIALATLVIFYNADRARRPLVMGLCRAAAYATVALVVRRDLCPEVRLGCALMLGYTSGVTSNPDGWSYVMFALPLGIALPHDAISTAIYASYVLWVGRSILMLRAGNVASARACLFAGSALLDALLAASFGSPEAAIAALVAFAVTAALPPRYGT